MKITGNLFQKKNSSLDFHEHTFINTLLYDQVFFVLKISVSV